MRMIETLSSAEASYFFERAGNWGEVKSKRVEPGVQRREASKHDIHNKSSEVYYQSWGSQGPLNGRVYASELKFFGSARYVLSKQGSYLLTDLWCWTATSLDHPLKLICLRYISNERPNVSRV